MPRPQNEVRVKSVKKALNLLSQLLFGDSEGKGIQLKTLAEKEKISVKTAHNLLQTMVHCGFVEKTSYGNYAPGKYCRAIAYNNQTATYQYQHKVTNILIKHSKQIHQGMVYAILENSAWTTFVEIENDGSHYRASFTPSQRYYLYETATGRVIFSFSTKEEQQMLIDENGDPDSFWKNYKINSEEIRNQGYCIAFRARYGSNSYAVPVINLQGKLMGAVGIFIPANESNEVYDQQLLHHLRDAAQSIAALKK